ncbi:MAG: hypothetical protein P4L87_00960 [Formivibrio sp.]|nr:hypothetical protein [Formivibrio sp.]
MKTKNDKYECSVRHKIENRLGLAETANTFASQSAQDTWDGFWGDTPPQCQSEPDSGDEASNAVSVGKSVEEKKVHIAVFEGKDGTELVVTYGTREEHGHNTTEQMALLGDQGYRWNDTWDMYDRTLGELTYAKQHENFVFWSADRYLSPADVELKERLKGPKMRHEEFVSRTRDEDLSPADIELKRQLERREQMLDAAIQKMIERPKPDMESAFAAEHPPKPVSQRP